jgi:predicted XRE-type DNA-binding protein
MQPAIGEVTYVESSGNVYADLGIENPEEMKLKAQIAMTIQRLMKQQRLTQTAAARRIGMPQPHLSDILRGKFRGYSVGKMLMILNRLGHPVVIEIQSQRQEDAHTEVLVA